MPLLLLILYDRSPTAIVRLKPPLEIGILRAQTPKLSHENDFLNPIKFRVSGLLRLGYSLYSGS